MDYTHADSIKHEDEKHTYLPMIIGLGASAVVIAVVTVAVACFVRTR